MKKRIGIGVILAAVLLLSAAGIAVDQWSLFKPLTNSATPILPLEGAEKLVETGLGSAANELVTVAVEQAVYDGQGVNVMARLTPKDAAHDALFNAWLMDAPEDLYEKESEPVKVPEGTQELERQGARLAIVNDAETRALYVDGEPVAIPETREAAEAAGLPVYLDGDALYYADQWDFQVKGRKDGKRMIFFDVSLTQPITAGDDAAAGSLDASMGMDAEEQPDGSVLVWFDLYAESPLGANVALQLRTIITQGPTTYPMDDIAFTLTRAEAEKTARYRPEADGGMSERVRLRDVSVRFTPVRAYLTVDYDYTPVESEEMGITFRLYDADGSPIETGSGWGSIDAEALGFYRWQMEMQTFAEAPEALVLEAKAIDGPPLGSCVCRLEG